MKRLFATILLMSILVGCQSTELEYYIPESTIPDYYLLTASGSIKLGSEFQDTSNQFEVLQESDDEVVYKQPFGLYHFNVYKGIITSLTTASPDTMISSRFYVGMPEETILAGIPSAVHLQYGDIHVYLDTHDQVALECKYDSEDKVSIFRVSCLRLQE